ncbi:hypothetical protein JW948_01145 [bacterium]|nr:hypothetical protein [bacterium]
MILTAMALIFQKQCLHSESGFNYFTDAIDISHATAGVWTEVNIAPYVPPGSTGAILELINESRAGSALRHAVRNHGSSDARQNSQRLSPNGHRYAFCGIGPEGTFESYIESDSCRIYLTGYTDSYVHFFVDAVDKSIGTAGSWQEINGHADGVPAGATGVIIDAYSSNGNSQVGIRKKGSSDDRTGTGSLLYSYRLCTNLLCGVDETGTFEGKISHTDGKFALIGYTMSPVYFLTDAVNISVTDTDTWTDINLSGMIPSRANGFIFEINNDYNYRRFAAIRRKGSTDDRSGNSSIYNNGFTHGTCGLNPDQQAQGFINQPTVDFYLTGYTVPYDPSPPSDISEIRDGSGPDLDQTYARKTLSLNWDASSDAESGIARYWASVGTSPGGTDIADWTDCGPQTNFTFENLTLNAGLTCYCSVRAQNGQGHESGVTVSDGITVLDDITPPQPAAAVRDGLAEDLDSTYKRHELSANWNMSSDPESGLYRYWLAIGSGPGASDILGWTDTGKNTSWTQTSLSLFPGQTLYISIRAENEAGLQSTVTCSDGILILEDPTPPSDILMVRDGLYTDLDYIVSASVLSASWTASEDPECGIWRYLVSAGSSPGYSDVAGWTDNGLITEITLTGLSLVPGSTCYFNVQAENTAGLTSGITSSDGVSILDPASESRIIECPDGTDISVKIQAAVAELASSGGGTIYLPEGDFPFLSTVSMPGGISIIGTDKESTILRSTGPQFFDINHFGTEGGSLRISGIGFFGYNPSDPGNPVQSGLSLNNIEGFRIDHCYFRSFKYVIGIGSRYNMPDLPQSYGVIDHCTFIRGEESTYLSMYGITDSRIWQQDMKMGTHEATFVEDCYFQGCSHCTDAFGGGHYVLRHSQIVDCGSVGGHGPGFDSSYRGTRCTEVYDNLIKKTDNVSYDYRWIGMGIRGGGGVVFNNTFEYCRNAIQFTCDTYSLVDSNGDGHYDYPALDQTHDKWLWNNTLVSTPNYIMHYGNGAEELIVENRDFFIRQPSVAEDGFEYTPYPYPHPLVLGDAVETDPVLLEVRVFLEGPYMSGQMTTDLGGIIPLESPWVQDPRTAMNIPPNVVDWILVELRTAPHGPAAACRSAFLSSLGNIVDLDGKNVNIEFDVPEGYYYIVIRHRNHMPVMSAEPVCLSESIVVF